MSPKVPTTKQFFRDLNKNTLYLIDEFYDEQVKFFDPMSEFTDRQQLKEYYANLYQNVESIEFKFTDEVVQRKTHVLVWTMTLVSKLNSGNPLTVQGVSHIRFGGKEGKVVYHRDYFDMGEFVYETIPVLNSIIGFIKKKLTSH